MTQKLYPRVKTWLAIVLATSFVLLVTRIASAQELEKGITWYGVLDDGLAEAERTGKPILLTSAAPQCIGVSGMW